MKIKLRFLRDALIHYFNGQFCFPVEYVLPNGFPFRDELRRIIMSGDESGLAHEIELSLFNSKKKLDSNLKYSNRLSKELGFSSQNQLETQAVSIALFLFENKSVEICFGGRLLSHRKTLESADSLSISRWLLQNEWMFKAIDVKADDDVSESDS